MGEVWQGRHVVLGAQVAIKLLRPGLALGERARQRFLNEARVMAQLNTNHAVRVHDVGVSDEGVPFLVMDLIDGESLAQKLSRERRLQPATAARLLGQAARGLERAHAMGIVHRDFKPDNVLLTLDEDGLLRAKVTDFGMAKLLRELAPEGEGAGDPEARVALKTPPAGVAGTPLYMAPEQFEPGGEVSHLTDVWAFGVVAYECLVGRLPFTGVNLRELRAAVRQAPRLASARNPALPTAFDAWFERACAVDPGSRFASIRFAAEALREALEVSSAGQPLSSLPSIRVALAPVERPAVDPLAATSDAGPPLPWGRPVVVALGLLTGISVASLGWILLGQDFSPSPARQSVTELAPVAPPSALPAPPASSPPLATPPTARPTARRVVSGQSDALPPAYRPLPDAPRSPLPPSFKGDPYR